MRVMIDGFNMGLPQGTGIASYGRELARILKGGGHEVSVLYGLNKSFKAGTPQWPQFIQNLINTGEGGKRSLSKLALRTSFYAAMNSGPAGIRPAEVFPDSRVDTGALKNRIPEAGRFYNLPLIYQAAQAHFRLLSRPLVIDRPKANPVDVFHLTCPVPVRMRSTANIVTVHDVIPLVLAQSTEVNLKQYFRLLKRTLRDADLIVAISGHSKRDLINFFDIPEDRVRVVYQSVNIPEKLKTMDDRLIANFLWKNHGLRPKEYLLYYGAIEPKKNVEKLMEGVSLATADLPLVIIGKDGWLCDDVKQAIAQLHTRPGGKRRYRRIPFASFSQLMAFLKGAKALLFPSLYEGFGLPVLEAMEMGCPVITSRTTSLPEVGGDAVYYVDPLDATSIAKAIDDIAGDPALEAQLIETGIRQAAKFSSENNLKAMLDAYNEATRQ